MPQASPHLACVATAESTIVAGLPIRLFPRLTPGPGQEIRRRNGGTEQDRSAVDYDANGEPPEDIVRAASVVTHRLRNEPLYNHRDGLPIRFSRVIRCHLRGLAETQQGGAAIGYDARGEWELHRQNCPIEADYSVGSSVDWSRGTRCFGFFRSFGETITRAGAGWPTRSLASLRTSFF